jgi:hypothetical protein
MTLRGGDAIKGNNQAASTGCTMNEFFRRIAFAEAVAAYKKKPNNPALSILVRGQDVPVAQICEEMVRDQGMMPDYLARDIGLAPPVTFAKGASYLKQYLVLPPLDVGEKK